MKTLLICNSISPVLIGEVTICWCVHEGGNVVSLNGLVILFFCYCCLVLSATVNVNSRDRETIRQNCPLHVVFRLGLIWDTSRLSYPKRLDLSACNYPQENKQWCQCQTWSISNTNVHIFLPRGSCTFSLNGRLRMRPKSASWYAWHRHQCLRLNHHHQMHPRHWSCG